MKNSRISILINKNHPWFQGLQAGQSYQFHHSFDDLMKTNAESDYLIDLLPASTQEKIKRYQNFLGKKGLSMISDLSSNIREVMASQVPVTAGLNSFFYSPKNNYEYFAESSQEEEIILELLNKLNFQGKKVSAPKGALVFPQIISQIINEAYLAREESLASEKDMDLAMRFGANYPLGPFEWSKKIGTFHVVNLLGELYAWTGQERYRASSLLVQQALKEK